MERNVLLKNKMKINNELKNMKIVKKKSHFYEGCGEGDKGGSKCIRIVIEDKITGEVFSGNLTKGDRKWLLD